MRREVTHNAFQRSRWVNPNPNYLLPDAHHDNFLDSAMAKEGYEPLPTSPVDYVDPSDSAIRKRSRSPLKQNWSKTRSVSPTQRRLHHELAADPRFHVPTPAPWKRVALLLFLAFLFYLAFSIRKVVQEPVKPKVVHAQRCAALA